MGSISRGVGRWMGLVLALGIVLPLQAEAQVRFGVSGGLSLAKLGGDDASDNLDSRTGFNGGAFLDFPLGGIIGVTTGLYYVQKGASSDGPLDAEVAIDYLEVPLLLRVTAVESSTADFNLFMGPTFAFEMKCEGTIAGVTLDCEDDEFPTKSFDLGAAFGAGISFPISPSMSVIGTALYDIGLRSIDDAGDDIKNEAVLLNVGLAWRMGG